MFSENSREVVYNIHTLDQTLTSASKDWKSTAERPIPKGLNVLGTTSSQSIGHVQ